ncbi:MAG: hypothetical protein LBE02_02320 [Spirochaetaceae bacterium]|jgi:hypothetical protein|nr:hypothetical protein [Spirochaetaceae bacterium]
MKKHPRHNAALPAAALPTAALFLLLCLFPPPAAAQTRTEEWVDTGRFGAEEPDDPSASPDASKGLGADWLYLGLRAGPSLRFYTPSDDTPYTGNDTRSVSLDVALWAKLQLFSFLSIQAETVFTWDNASLWAYTGTVSDYERYTKDYRALSFQFPLVIKLDFYPGAFKLSPFAGAYYLFPLGNIEASLSLNNDKESFNYTLSPSIGVLGGLSGAMKFGPGMIIIDLRYAADLGEFKVEDANIFKRSMISLTLGYEFGFFTKQKRGRP